jgi:hypothetical protein
MLFSKVRHKLVHSRSLCNLAANNFIFISFKIAEIILFSKKEGSVAESVNETSDIYCQVIVLIRTF